MRYLVRCRPSASMIVAGAALIVAAGGTAVAAGTRVSGDSLIKRDSLSGNRLRYHTLGGSQVNAAKLGEVPNAARLGGQPPSAYDPSGNFTRGGLVRANRGHSVTLARFGSFTLTLRCATGSGTASQATITVTSTATFSSARGSVLSATPTTLASTASSGAFSSSHERTSEFLTPGSAYYGEMVAAVNYPGTASSCVGNALVEKAF